MASNDEVVWQLPGIQCPSCGCFFAVHRDRMIYKYTRRQREQRKKFDGLETGQTPSEYLENMASLFPEKAFIVVTCDLESCEQYNKIKVIEMQRLKAPSVRVNLE